MEVFNDISLIGNILIVLFTILILFHICVLIGIIPHNIVWAGKVKSKSELIKLESISIIILLISIFILSMKLEYFNVGLSSTIINIGIWLLFAMYVLNTIGNLFAKSPIEKYGFGLLTFIISSLLLLIAIG
ncbi:MAG: hypothetical protein KDC88_16595 [Ignavibacteriae bacterium]|nr:hypothetical protein [Ignavibacteriota bacterium]